MVAKVGDYFRRPLKGYHDVMQGDLLSPMISNVVVDAIIHHWVMVVTPTEAGTGEIGMTIIYLH